MRKFPDPPGSEALRQIAAETLDLPAGTPLARIYFSAGPYASHWNQFRHVGPTSARRDHRLHSSSGEPTEQHRAVLYCAPQVDTCAAEVFQATRRNDRIRNAPALAVFALHATVTLLDLRGVSATRIGASAAIHSGPRSRARAWARQLYEAYPNVQGFQYGSSTDGHAPRSCSTNARRERCPRNRNVTAPSTTTCWSMYSNESPYASRTGFGSYSLAPCHRREWRLASDETALRNEGSR